VSVVYITVGIGDALVAVQEGEACLFEPHVIISVDIVNADNDIAAFQQASRHMEANETSNPRHQYMHVKLSPPSRNSQPRASIRPADLGTRESAVVCWAFTWRITLTW